MRSLVLALLSAFSVSAFATTQLNIALGASVPADTSGQTLVEPAGPSRANGGEHIIIKMGPAKNITGIKITAFSTGKAGKALIHNVTGTNGAAKTAIDSLYTFAKVTMGNPTNYQNLAMVADSQYVESQPNMAFAQIDFQIEGFTNNDASVLIQITTTDPLPTQDYLITRTSSNTVLGGMINEATYARFTAANLQSLMTYGAAPVAADVVGHTFSCTTYTKLNPTQLDYKKRMYSATASGAIQSISDLEGTGSYQTWTASAAGLQLAISNQNGCGKYTTTNVTRKTGAGNLVSEVVLDLNSYIQLCTAAGYDPTATQAVESNSTFPSVISSTDVVDSYEFCRLLN
jgi:hypothetical protein